MAQITARALGSTASSRARDAHPEGDSTRRYKIHPPGDGAPFTVTLRGRVAWALDRLRMAGPTGCTPILNPAPRWSAYVHDLRELGIAIETVRERHGPPFPGEHGRYVLRSVVERIEEGEA